MVNNTNANTAAYGCELMIKSSTDNAPSISEIVVLLFTHAIAWQFCNASVRIPITVIEITAARYAIFKYG